MSFKRRAAAGLATLLLAGCAGISTSEGDRLFANGDFAAAKTAYESYLGRGPADGRRRERALYHLGLIHARPDGAFHDPVKAQRYLERLIAQQPPSPYASQAALVLALQIETHRLRDEMADQKGLARLLLAELSRLRAEAEEIENTATGEQEKARRLADRIRRLETDLDRLTADLAAREEELERLKKIDLEDPP